MTFTCPAGHESTTGDYCDTCGAAISEPPAATVSPAAPVAPAAPPAGGDCPNCGSPRAADDVFCEVCGLDFATGRLPAPPPPPVPVASAGPAAAAGAGQTEATTPAEWTVLVEADREFFDSNQAEPADGSLSFPEGEEAREIPLSRDTAIIGRRSNDSGAQPDIDLGDPWGDPGVSRLHATLHRREGEWVIVDEGSTNGTRVRDQGDPIIAGVETELADGDVIHVGAWTRVTLRRAGAAAEPVAGVDGAALAAPADPGGEAVPDTP